MGYVMIALVVTAIVYGFVQKLQKEHRVNHLSFEDRVYVVCFSFFATAAMTLGLVHGFDTRAYQVVSTTELAEIEEGKYLQVEIEDLEPVYLFATIEAGVVRHHSDTGDHQLVETGEGDAVVLRHEKAYAKPFYNFWFPFISDTYYYEFRVPG